MRKTGMVGLMILLMGAISSVWPDNACIRVGVSKGAGAESIIAVLNKRPGIRAAPLPRFTPAALEECDVAIVPQYKIPLLIIRGSIAIRHWVENGGGVMFTHDAVGFRRHMAVFQEIGGGVGNAKLDRIRVARIHPITAGMAVGLEFAPGFQYDHITMENGGNGVVVLDNARGEPALLAGAVGRGRVVLNGMLTGYIGRKADGGGGECEPADIELNILVNAVRWLAGRDAAAPEKTGTETLAAAAPTPAGATPAVNLMSNPGAEELMAVTNRHIPGGLCPRGWGAYGGGSDFEWGISTNMPHGGRTCVYMMFKAPYVKKDSDIRIVSSALILSETDGIAGAKALPVNPDTIYAFSFWLKGDLPMARLNKVFSWNSLEAGVQDREFLPVSKVRKNGMLLRRTVKSGGLIFPEARQWNHYSGEFTTLPETKKVAPAIFLDDAPGLAPGQAVYVDDVEIMEKYHVR